MASTYSSGPAGAPPAALPPGSVRQGGNSTTDVYHANGTTYVTDKNGNVLYTHPSSQDNGESVLSDITGGIRSTTDKLGITAPDPHNSPEFQQLMQAAQQFGGNYNQDRANAADSRNIDLQTIADLQAAAEGRTPSAAEALMRKSIDQSANQALGLAATLGGTNPGMALRAGLNAQQQMATKSAADIAAQRASEMAAARELLAQQTARGRAVDASTAGTTGSQYAGIVGAPYGATERTNAANQALMGSVINSFGQYLGNSGKSGGYAQPSGDSAAAESDISAKKDIGPGSAAADAFLSTLPRGPAPTAADPRSIENRANAPVQQSAADAFLSTLDPKTYRYKQPDVNKPAGKRLGVMANSLPPNDVVTGPDGKKWISANVIGDVLAGVGRLHDRVSSLESGGKQQLPPGDSQNGIMIPQSAVHDYLAGLGIVPP